MHGIVVICCVTIFTLLLFFTINNKCRKKGKMYMKLWFQSKIISGGLEFDSSNDQSNTSRTSN